MKRYKDKISVWRGALSIVVIALALVGCTKESIDSDGPLGDKLQLRVVVPQSTVTRAAEEGSSDENRLDKIAVFVFDGSGKLETTIIIPDLNDPSVATSQPQWATKKILALPIVGQVEPRNIYVVANWTPPTIDESTYTETMLNAELTTITGADDMNGAKAYPMLMSGVTKGGTTSPNVTVDVARQVAKIRTSITLPKTTQDNNPNIEWLTDRMTITVASVLDKSYIFEGQSPSYPSSAKLISEFGKFVFTDMSPAQTFPITTDMTWEKERVYVHESLPNDMGNATYIVIQLPYRNYTTGVEEVDNYYKIYVGEQTDPDAPYRMFRNTIYDLKIKILGLGMPFDNIVADVNIEDQLTVIPWEEDNIDVEDGLEHSFMIDRTRVEFQYFAQTQTVYFNPDIYEPDWKLYNKADGSVFLSSTDASGKSVTLDGIKYTLTIDIPAITMEKAAEGEFPKTKQEFYFQVKNLKTPFVVVYENGFIPSSVLAQGFTVGETDYQGWPTPLLPIRGLQVAKLGNVLPTGAAKADDPLMYWSNIYEDTGITATELGTGKSNYVQLKAKGAADYPIGQACEHLGPEWYVPSVDELVLIYNNKSTFGISYLFIDKMLYSTTTDHEKVPRWCVDFEDGKLSSAYKTYTVRVRCVRNI